MEPATPVNQDYLKGRFYNAVTVLLALVVSVDVCYKIARHWPTYDGISKLLAIALLLNLAIVPLLLIVKLSKGQEAKPDMLVQTAYIWVMLATMLFSR
jgi:drug/metabolite transporter (DMT)-like permease